MTKHRMIRTLSTLFALAAIAAVAAFLFAAREHDAPALTKRQPLPKDAARAEMVRLSGLDEHGRPYAFQARLAERLEVDKDSIRLRAPRGEMAFDDQSKLVFSADTGRYMQQQRRLRLRLNVHISQPGAYDLEGIDVLMELASRRISSDHPVRLKLGNGEVRAQGMRMDGRRRVWQFRGPVVSHFETGGAASTDEAPERIR